MHQYRNTCQENLNSDPLQAENYNTSKSQENSQMKKGAQKNNLKMGEIESTFDIFGTDGFGIKILDEIFLCRQCQNEIPLQDCKVIEKTFRFLKINRMTSEKHAQFANKKGKNLRRLQSSFVFSNLINQLEICLMKTFTSVVQKSIQLMKSHH